MKRITNQLPSATLSQRLASLSDAHLMLAARTLARNPKADFACTAVLEELERRQGGPSFEAFVAGIYA